MSDLSRIRTSARITVYAVAGEDTFAKNIELEVQGDRIDSERVVLLVPPNGGGLTVVADDLIEAIKRCSR